MYRRSFLKYGSALTLTIGGAGVRDIALAQAAMKSKGVYAAPGLSFAGLFIANNLKTWALNGLDLDLRQTQGGPLAMAAMTNNEADFAGVASSDPVIAWDKGIKTLTIAAFTSSLVAQFTARNSWLDKVGVGPNSTLQDKVKAFKGARIGASTIGGGPAQYTRYLARSVGLDPEKDMKVLAVGFGASRMAALRADQVDLTIGDSPEADQVELEGFGKLFINCAEEVPFFKEFPYTVLSVTPEFADRSPEVVRRVAHTLGQANDSMRTDTGKVIDILKTAFPNIPAVAIERSVARDHLCYPSGGRMTETMWRNNATISADMKMIAAPIPFAEGELWTNKFTS